MNASVAAKTSSRIYWSVEDIQRRIESSPVVVFARGTETNPGCGYSERAYTAVKKYGKPFDAVDVSMEPSIGSALREYAGRHVHFPLIFINGTLVSTSDTLERQLESGELKEQLERIKY